MAGVTGTFSVKFDVYVSVKEDLVKILFISVVRKCTFGHMN